jgi:thiol-disulfide isomerase/thioredoxin
MAAKLAAALVAAVMGLGAVYAMAGAPDNGGGTGGRFSAGIRIAQAATAAAPSASTDGLNTGEMAKFVFKKTPEALPEMTFQDGTGKERTIKDWQGRVVLLNVWATWCIPCRKEMPSLEKLQAELGSDKFEVVAISADRGGIEASKKFLDQIKVSKLGLYADPSTRSIAALKVPGLPATLLIDRQGREIGRLLGPAEWDSEDAKKLLKAVIQ